MDIEHPIFKAGSHAYNLGFDANDSIYIEKLLGRMRFVESQTVREDAIQCISMSADLLTEYIDTVRNDTSIEEPDKSHYINSLSSRLENVKAWLDKARKG